MRAVSQCLRASALAVTLVAAGAPAALHAQGATPPKVFYACYVPSAGTVYRIKEPGLLQACLTRPEPHVQFSWTDGAGAMRSGDAAGGDLGGTFPNPSVLKLLGRAMATTAPTDGQVYTWDAATSQWKPTTPAVSGPAGGDLAGTYPNPSVAKLRGQALSATAPTSGQVLQFDGSAWTPTTPSSGVTDHGALTGLGDDDHPQYLRADGTRALAGSMSAGGFKITNLGSATANGDAVRFEQAVKQGDAAQGDLAGTFPGVTVAKLRGVSVAATAPTAGQVLTFDGSNWAPATPASSGGGVTDHGALTGLLDDDHPQYLLANGVRSSTNGFAVTGAFGTGSIPVSGSGTRLMWYPRKAAFRAGGIGATQWDDGNIGEFSAAFGTNTTASGNHSVAFGQGARSSGVDALSSGSSTVASGDEAVAMGTFTQASGSSSVALGFRTTASGNAAVALGSITTASGLWSTAIGREASTNGQQGSFVYGDGSNSGALVSPTGPNQFVVRAIGGFRLRTSTNTQDVLGANENTGCDIDPTGNLACSGTIIVSSDVNLKTGFEPMDADSVLSRLAALRIQRWSYKADGPAVRHVGPIAQDFRAAFGLGRNEKTISTVDADGINMLAIQALERRTREIATLRQQNAELRARLARLEEVVERLERSAP